MIAADGISLLPGEESTQDRYVDRHRLGGVPRNLVGTPTWLERPRLFRSYSGWNVSGVAGSRIPGECFLINQNHSHIIL